MQPPAIVIRDLQREFPWAGGTTRVLQGIDLIIEPGEFVAITGASGSGKSTLLNILGSLDRDYQGSCRVGGAEIMGLDDRELATLRRRVFGYVFQDFGLIPVLTCAENVCLPAAYDGVPDTAQHAAADRLLGEFGLRHRASRYPETLSGGERQRCAIARALINDAPILIADEPTGALDSANASAVMDILEGLNREGRTVVMVTHAAELAERAGRIVALKDGRVAGMRAGAFPRQTGEDSRSSSAMPATGGRASFGSRIAEAARVAARTLKRRRLQSALTALGIAIGSASVIALATIGDGARSQVINRIEALGSDLITISRGPPGVRGGERLVTTLVADDIRGLTGLPGVQAITPEMDGVAVAKHRSRDFMVTVTGTNEQFPQVRDWRLHQGTFFGAESVKRYTQVAVLGSTVARNLFGEDAVPVGSYILINNAPYRVLGVMERKGVTTGPGHDRDNQIWLPHTTAGARLFGRSYVERLVVKTESGTDVDMLVAELRARMIARHGREDFSVNTLAEIIRAATSAQRTLDYFLATIAVISLLVGGVGVMNIMLASVNERIREIGIRMAVGATRHDILTQFLSESVALCVAGGVAGILLGVAVVVLTSLWTGIPAQLTTTAFMLAGGSAVIVGLVFGVVPASRAAAIDPAAAFRQAI
jgi:macrolide transport system ATP-binding/permease protein